MATAPERLEEASDYRPRLVFKIDERIKIPLDDDLGRHFRALDPDLWRRIESSVPGVSVQRVFTSVPPDRLQELAQEAAKRDPKYVPVDFLSYFALETEGAAADLREAVQMLRSSKLVERAYIDPPGEEPAVNPNDPRVANQGYLDAAPVGVDAKYAWGHEGGDGKGQKFIDMERGWRLDHEDLDAHGISIVQGPNRVDSRPHGTSVLGIVCAVDNSLGVVGIAPNVASVKVVSCATLNRADAISLAESKLSLGGVLLLESQVMQVEVDGTVWSRLPLEALSAEYEAIRQATARGITVVECAGNGGEDLDAFKDDLGVAVLRPGVRDSVAIVVGAATSQAPHSSLASSNFGSRVDCYAWGTDIETTNSTGANLKTAYTGNFGQTSGAGAIIAGVALSVQGVAAARGQTLNAYEMRDLLRENGTKTARASDLIGVMPDLKKIIAKLPAQQSITKKKSKKKKAKKKAKTKKKTKGRRKIGKRRIKKQRKKNARRTARPKKSKKRQKKGKKR